MLLMLNSVHLMVDIVSHLLLRLLGKDLISVGLTLMSRHSMIAIDLSLSRSIIGKEKPSLFHFLLFLKISMIRNVADDLVGIHDSHRLWIISHLSQLPFRFFEIFMVLHLTLKPGIFSQSSRLRCLSYCRCLDLRTMSVEKDRWSTPCQFQRKRQLTLNSRESYWSPCSFSWKEPSHIHRIWSKLYARANI